MLGQGPRGHVGSGFKGSVLVRSKSVTRSLSSEALFGRGGRVKKSSVQKVHVTNELASSVSDNPERLFSTPQGDDRRSDAESRLQPAARR
jgi:hypothetical protein